MFRKLLFTLGVSLLAVQAQATTVISQTRTGTLNFALLLGGSNISIIFDQFNIPTQRLTNVDLSFSTGASAEYIVTNVNLFGSPSSRSITLSRGLSAALTGNGFSLSGSDLITKTQNVPRPAVVSFGVYAPQISGSGSLTSGFAPFTGPGTLSFNLFVQQSGNSLTGSPNLGLTTAAANPLTLSSNFTATLTYNAVPEPQTWALLLTGFGLAGIALRRRRRLAIAAA